MSPAALKSLSIIIPAYNEERTIHLILDKVRDVELVNGITKDVVIVNDGSTDGTVIAVEQYMAANPAMGIRFFQQPRNMGKGAAIHRGILEANGEYLIIQDADLEYDPFDLPTLLGPILENRADAVFGSRFLGGPHRVLYFWHSVGNGLLTLISNMFTDLNLTDMETCYKMARTGLMKSLPLKTDRFGIEPELTARFAQARARIYEVPISYNGRTYAEGKKINWKDGVAAFWHIFRSNVLDPRAPVYDRAIEAGHAAAVRAENRAEPRHVPMDAVGDRR